MASWNLGMNEIWNEILVNNWSKQNKKCHIEKCQIFWFWENFRILEVRKCQFSTLNFEKSRIWSGIFWYNLITSWLNHIFSESCTDISLNEFYSFEDFPPKITTSHVNAPKMMNHSNSNESFSPFKNQQFLVSQQNYNFHNGFATNFQWSGWSMTNQRISKNHHLANQNSSCQKLLGSAT